MTDPQQAPLLEGPNEADEEIISEESLTTVEKERVEKLKTVKQMVLDGLATLISGLEKTIVQCEDNTLANQIGVGQVFPVNGQRCILGHVAKNSGGSIFCVPMSKSNLINEITIINDKAPKETRHLAVIRPLKEWRDEVVRASREIKKESIVIKRKKKKK